VYEGLKKAVCNANLQLQKQKLVICSWGNVSGIDRQAGVVAIKPSGVPYDKLTSDKIAILDIDSNNIEGDLRPSSDTPTHLELYRNLESVGAICHSHCPNATMWAQACREIPCFGTTHADYFYGPIPLTEVMTEGEIQNDYELNTGKVIIRRFADIDPMQVPAVLVANHGPFTWGKTPDDAVEAMVVLEQIATTALGTITINPTQNQIGQVLLDKHYLRKHGKDAYYGQKSPE